MMKPNFDGRRTDLTADGKTDTRSFRFFVSHGFLKMRDSASVSLTVARARGFAGVSNHCLLGG
jgi:hypothetical protein